MLRLIGALASTAGLISLGAFTMSGFHPAPSPAGGPDFTVGAAAAATPERSVLPPEPIRALPPVPPPPPPPPTPQEALNGGVLVVVSIPSQKAFVFRKGELWDTSPVSTGKKGHETPEGAFAILQKKVMHHSNLYDDAPMPYMQRLTWDGVALHAGRIPGYPASHGCVRLPKEFAKKLYEVTNFHRTIVIVAGEPVNSAKEARKLA